MPARDAGVKALDRAMALLTEHYENVTVFASRFDGGTGNTGFVCRGHGNWHARHGQVREWLVKTNAEARVEARRAMDGE